MRMLALFEALTLCFAIGAQDPAPVGKQPTPDHEWGQIEGHGWGWRFKDRTQAKPHTGPGTITPAIVPPQVSTLGYTTSGDGLDEVNAKRRARGLRPFIRDEALTQAAFACAAHRAAEQLFGHTSWDNSFLPPGTPYAVTGCAAYPPSYGWMSCCTYDNYTRGGAAWVLGKDGNRYMHLFVR